MMQPAGSTSVYQPSFTHGPFETGIAVDRLRDLGAGLTAIPDGFELNDKLKRFGHRPAAQSERRGRLVRLGVQEERSAFASLRSKNTLAGFPTRIAAAHVQPAPRRALRPAQPRAPHPAHHL
ncbi:MAG: hypothetical protein R3F11_00970 [Verrucomicrobiales bacterium]